MTRRSKDTDPKPRRSLFRRFFGHPIGKTLTALVVFVGATAVFTFLYFYLHYARLTEEKLAIGPYSTTSKLYSAPQVIAVGDRVSQEEIAVSLHRAGYSKSRSNRMGWYHERPDGLEIFPGVDSYFQQEAHVVKLDEGRVGQIISLRDNTERTQLWLEPEMVTSLFDRNREKRRIVRFQDIPQMVRNSLLAAEDKRFFQHAGFDPFRIAKAAWLDISSQQLRAGASTLSMQLARSILLTTERSWRRKIPEILITIHLERKLTKEEIFEHYFNTIYLGRVGSFNIHGLGQGAQAYFGKDIRDLTLAETATVAGLIQSPSGYNPFRNPDRAKRRRNIILQMMRDNGFISEEQMRRASEEELGITQGAPESDEAPYFVDLLNDTLQNQFQDHDFQKHSYRVYTTLDLNLQRAAAEAMRDGLKEVDAALERRGRTAKKGWPQVQAALVAIDPRTSEVKALIGGRNYGSSQLNRALAQRQTGSIFKPFVYAAALDSARDGGPHSITPAMLLEDEPTTFWFDGKPYEPNNYRSQFNGTVTLRRALSKSLNIPTIKLAEMVGYQRVTSLARQVGLKTVKSTPSAALGAYEATPLEMAAAYTVFANKGVYAAPNWIRMIRDEQGNSIHTHRPAARQILDSRVAYMMVNLLEGVMQNGTGAGARSRGFGLPAAGKTGTDDDGWFAGFTSELLCVVWVGYDDNRDIGLEGAQSALPIWTHFMKSAHKFRPYRSARGFGAPDGVITMEIDAESGKLAGAGGCGGPTRTEVFLVGTQPLETCGGGGATQVASWDTEDTAAADSQPRRVASREVRSIPVKPIPQTPEEAPRQAEQPRKRGLVDRILGVFK